MLCYSEYMSNLHLPANPTLADIQEYVEEMERERGFDSESLLHSYLLLTEEVGELAKVIRKDHSSMRTDAARTYEDDAASEIADIFIVLAAVANRLGVDIEAAVRAKEEKNKLRKWQ